MTRLQILRQGLPVPHAHRRASTLTRMLRSALGLVLLAPLSGCVVFVGAAALGGLTGSVVGGRSLPDSLVTVRFASPVDLPVRRPSPRGDGLGDTLWVRGASSVIGRMTARSGDTLRLEVVEVSNLNARRAFRRGTAATFVLVPTGVVKDSVGVRTERWLGGTVGALLGLGILVAMLVTR